MEQTYQHEKLIAKINELVGKNFERKSYLLSISYNGMLLNGMKKKNYLAVF